MSKKFYVLAILVLTMVAELYHSITLHAIIIGLLTFQPGLILNQNLIDL